MNSKKKELVKLAITIILLVLIIVAVTVKNDQLRMLGTVGIIAYLIWSGFDRRK